MPFFTELKQQLIQQLNSHSNESDFIELRATVRLKKEERQNSSQILLGWLKGQGVFPQFFWQSRDHDLRFATIGAIFRFNDLTEAQDFSQKYGYRLFGGIQFEGQCHFVLPRLALTQNADQLTACLYLFPQEKANIAELLAPLEQTAPLNKIENRRFKQQKISDFARWEQLIQHATQAIEKEQFRKVVLANATIIDFEKPLSPYDLLLASQKQNIGCYHFLWSEQENSAFIGSSPECLYQRNGNQLQTEALAGTVAVTDDSEQTEHYRQWLLGDKKNIYENQLVVDDIQHNLSDCIEHINVKEIEIKRLHNVQHLRRRIQAMLLNSTTDADCLTRIHPTAAVAGLPRYQALEFINKNEGFKRGWYAGTLGSFTPKNAEFCVALRSATISDTEITLYAGAGIVESSQAQSEWEEIERKALALGKLLP